MAKELRVLELFAGIGACSKALTNLGIPHKIVDAVEIDKYAIKSFNAIHNTNFEPQDISQWDKDLEVEFMNFRFPEPIELKTKLNDILEPVVDDKFYLSDKALACFMSNGTGNYPRRERFLQNINRKNREIGDGVTTRAGSRPTDNFVTEPVCVASRGRGENNEQHLEPRRDGVTNTITTVQKDNYIAVLVDDTYKNREPREYEDYSPTLRAGRSGLKVISANKQCITNTLTTNGYRIRKLTPLECWRLMGFDDEDFRKAEQVNSNAQLYKQAGNSIVVNVIMSITQELFGGIYGKE